MSQENKPIKIVIKRVIKEGKNPDLIPSTENSPIVEIPSPEMVAERLLAKPTTIHVFVDFADHALNMADVNEYLKKTFGPNFIVEFHGELTNYLTEQVHQPVEKVAEEFVRGKVWVGRQQGFGHIQSLSQEEKIQLEQQLLELSPDEKKDFATRSQSQKLENEGGPRLGSYGRRSLAMNDCYHHTELVGAIRNLLPEKLQQSTTDRTHMVLVITGRTIGEPENQGFAKGIHLRAGYMWGSIALVSTEGLTKAPAYPLEVQRSIQMNAQTGNDLWDISDDARHQRFREARRAGKRGYEAFLEVYDDKILQPHDARLTQAIRGLMLQTLLFAAGETGPKVAMCTTSGHEPNPDVYCRCHDAHFSEEVIQTQIKKPGELEFCGWHLELFRLLQNFQSKDSESTASPTPQRPLS